MTLAKFRTQSNPVFPSLFDDFLIRDNFYAPGLTTGVHTPKSNILKHDKGFEIELAIPGMEKELISLEVIENFLEISGSTEQSENKENSQYTQKEFSMKTFKKRFELPETALTDKIKADYRNGILYIDIPVNLEEKKAVRRQITIK